jgi:hypothetical protein
VKARQAGDFLTAVADTEFAMTAFGITPPNAGTARARDRVHIQVSLIARKSLVRAAGPAGLVKSA